MILILALACSGSEADPPTGSTPSGSDSGVVDSVEALCSRGDLAHDPTVGSYEQVALADGLTLVLQQGPQGGYHVDMNGRVEPVPDVGVVVVAELLLEDGTQVAYTDGSQAAFSTWDDCVGVYEQARMFWNAQLDAATLCSFVGLPATLTQTVEDLGSDRTISASFDVVFDVVLFNGTCADVQ
jgi:hypothetical protein